VALSCVVLCVTGSIDEVDHTAVGAAISTITTNLPEMTRGVRMIAALMEDESSGEKLLDAARKLCSAFSDLLKAAEPETKEVTLMLNGFQHFSSKDFGQISLIIMDILKITVNFMS
jgi:hypothetical protein